MSRLELASHIVETVDWGDETRLDAGTLVLSPDELEAAGLGDEQHLDLRFHIVRPGESVRVSGILDVVEPRTKGVGSSGSTFSGIDSEAKPSGVGLTHVVQGLTVMAAGSLPDRGETFVQEDCLVDMGGPGACFSPFSAGPHVVVEFGGLERHAGWKGIVLQRQVTVRIARHLAEVAARETPDELAHFGAGSGVPAVGGVPTAYVCSLISEGPLHDTLLYGRTTEALRPRWIDAAELADGALVSSDFHFACQRTPTVLYQRNPIVEAIAGEPGLALSGVILTLRYGSDDAKRTAAREISRMLVERGVRAAVTHPAVGGNAHIDALDIVEECERVGIATTLVLQEMAGDEGADSGLVDFVAEADAMVSTGNRDQLVRLPRPEKLIGPERLRDGTSVAGPLVISLRSFLASTGQVGAHTMTTLGV